MISLTPWLSTKTNLDRKAMIGKIEIETKEEDIGVEGETLMNIEIKDKTGQKETTKQNSKEEGLRMMIVNTDE